MCSLTSKESFLGNQFMQGIDRQERIAHDVDHDNDTKAKEWRIMLNKLRQATEACILMINQQQKALQGFHDLAEEHANLKTEYELIRLENKMLELDLERERWIHNQHLKKIL